MSSKGAGSIMDGNQNNIPKANSKIKLKFNSQIFTATLLDIKSV